MKDQRSQIEEQRKTNAAAVRRMDATVSLLKSMSPEMTEWNEALIRQTVDTVKVLSADMITVYLRGGIEITKSIIN